MFFTPERIICRNVEPFPIEKCAICIALAETLQRKLITKTSSAGTYTRDFTQSRSPSFAPVQYTPPRSEPRHGHGNACFADVPVRESQSWHGHPVDVEMLVDWHYTSCSCYADRWSDALLGWVDKSQSCHANAWPEMCEVPRRWGRCCFGVGKCWLGECGVGSWGPWTRLTV